MSTSSPTCGNFVLTIATRAAYTCVNVTDDACAWAEMEDGDESVRMGDEDRKKSERRGEKRTRQGERKKRRKRKRREKQQHQGKWWPFGRRHGNTTINKMPAPR